MDMAPDDDDFGYGDEIAEQIGYYDEDDELGSSDPSPGTQAQIYAAAAQQQHYA